MSYLDHGEYETNHGEDACEHFVVLPVLEVLDVASLHPPLNLLLHLLMLVPLIST